LLSVDFHFGTFFLNTLCFRSWRLSSSSSSSSSYYYYYYYYYYYGLALGYGLDDRGFGSHQGIGIFFFFTSASRPALGPSQSPFQWVSEALSSGGKAASI
jgi:hypothetical protein